MSCEIRLTPGEELRWQGDEEPSSLAAAFALDWRSGLFELGTEKVYSSGSPTLAFWHDLARRYLVALCQVPEGSEIVAPSVEERQALIQAAPPMSGGEYLSAKAWGEIWRKLDDWVGDAVGRAGGLDPFLSVRARRWRQVGRVYFHLAENKSDEERPFAFLATYTTGVGAGGRLKHIPLRKSLELYAGARNRPALIKLLSPIQQAGLAQEWVQEMIDSGEVYQGLAWPVERAYQFLSSAESLEDSGLAVMLPNWWKRRPRPRVSVSIGPAKDGHLGANSLLQFDVSVAVGELSLSELEVSSLLAGPEGLVQLKGQWVEVNRKKLQEALSHWKTLQKEAARGQVSFVEGMRLLAGASADLKGLEESEPELSWAHVEAGDELREVLTRLRHPETLDSVDPGERLQATLRPYQRIGVSWMNFLTRLGLGACLADDMGLGKTIQVLALLLSQPSDGTPSLLVIPASLLGNWRVESERFAPSLRVLFCHPSEAGKARLARLSESPQETVAEVDLVVTTYAMLTRQPWLREIAWRTVILDEAQAIKNAGTRQSQAVKKLRAQARIALTGTPVENKLGDLWSLFDFLNPGLLGSATLFSNFVKTLQSRPQNPFAPLRQLVGPYILRRLKTDRSIISDLPDKVETPAFCGLTKPQVKLYERSLGVLQKALQGHSGMSRRGLVLKSLTELKQICNHPSQYLGDGEYLAASSGKFLRLAEICQLPRD